MIRLDPNTSTLIFTSANSDTVTMRSIEEILNNDKPPSLMCSNYNGFSSLEEDDVSKYEMVVPSSPRPDSPVDSALSMTTQSSSNFTISVDSMFNTGSDSMFSPRLFVNTSDSTADSVMSSDSSISISNISSSRDLAAIWTDDRKRVTSLSSTSTQDDLDSPIPDNVSTVAVIDDEDDSVDVNVVVDDALCEVSNSVQPGAESDECEVNESDEDDFKPVCVNRLNMTVEEARAYVNKLYLPLTQLPPAHLSDDERAQHILRLAKSDVTLAEVKKLVKHDRQSIEMAYRIIKPIPLIFRWDVVEPEDIPCCYTVVTDCKKNINRDSAPRPMNAYMIWAQPTRRLINELVPRTQNAVISSVLGNIWKEESSSFRAPFEKKKQKLLRFHKTQFPDYKYQPKTKDQKYLEKHKKLEKAKAKAMNSKKRKLSEESEASPKSKKCKVIRPKKTPPSPTQALSQPATQGFINISESSPTKQTKDRLTLKLMKTKSEKERMLNPSPTNIPTSKSLVSLESSVKPTSIVATLPVSTKGQRHSIVQFSNGQLSPAELGSPEVVEFFKDNMIIDQDKPSSVYDTPANTPPVEGEEAQMYVSDDLVKTPSSIWNTVVSTHFQPSQRLPRTIQSAVVIAEPSTITTAQHTSSQTKPATRMPFITAMLDAPVQSINHSQVVSATPVVASVNNNITKTSAEAPLIAVPVQVTSNTLNNPLLCSTIITLNHNNLVKSSSNTTNSFRLTKSGKRPIKPATNSRILTPIQSRNGFVPLDGSSVFATSVTNISQSQPSSEKLLFRQLAPSNAENTPKPRYRFVVKNGSITETVPKTNTSDSDIDIKPDIKPDICDLTPLCHDADPIMGLLETRDIKPLPISINGVPVTESASVPDDLSFDLGDLKDVDLDLNVPLFNDTDMNSLIQTLQN